MPLPWSGFIWSKGNLWTICAMSKAWKRKATTGRKFWKKKWSHIEKFSSTCFLSFLQRKLQLAPPSSAAPCDKVCSGKSGKRNRWLLPPTNPTMVPSLHALLARPHWVTKATFCGCHTAAQENTSSLFTVSPGLTHEQRSVTTPLLPVSLPCSKIDQIKSHCKVSYCLAARSLGLFLLQLNKTLDHSNWSLLHQKASDYLLWHSSRVLFSSSPYQAQTSTFSELRWWRSTLLKLGIISLRLTPDRL